MRQYRIVPIEYLKSLFDVETYRSNVFKECDLDVKCYGFQSVLDINDLASLRIPKQTFSSSRVLDEELMKFQGKRVFYSNDDLQLISQSKNMTATSNKRVFESCDKRFFSKVEKRMLKK